MLEFEPSGGIIRFAGERAVILDAVALGLLRKELIGTIGSTAAHGVLSRLGFAPGWRTAESMKTGFPWDSPREWQTAGGRLHTLQGLVTVRPVPRSSESAPFAEAIWTDSYEAEQHILHLGRSDEPVCWTLTGFVSGYLSCCNGREIYAIERSCRGQGDAVCRVEGRGKDEWDESIRRSFAFYEAPCLETALKQTTDALKTVERKLRSRRQELATVSLLDTGRGEGGGRSGRGRHAGGAERGGRTGGNAVAGAERTSPMELDPSGLIAASEKMRHVLDLARRVAPVESTVLLTGESGVGKERLARLIHESSPRAGGPFVAVNCAAIPEGLLESELFGHVRGAFTGATQDRVGLFAAAQGGTLFLDEVGEMAAGVQVKLLRVLQEREIRRVGESSARKVDVRLLAATNRELAGEVTAGVFRKDLYYRLRVVELRIPPLRERKADVLPLARMLLGAALKRTGRKLSGFSPAAADQLLRYNWPGNVRELENAVERAVALAGGERVMPEDLPEEIRAALPGAHTPGRVETLATIERDYILAVLAANENNRERTAAQLGIGTATLYRRLKLYGAGN